VTRSILALLLVLAVAAPVLAGDGHFRHRRETTRSYLERNHIVGGRSVSPGSYYSRRDYGGRYGYGSRYGRHRGGDTTVIIIERPSYRSRRLR